MSGGVSVSGSGSKLERKSFSRERRPNTSLPPRRARRSFGDISNVTSEPVTFHVFAWAGAGAGAGAGVGAASSTTITPELMSMRAILPELARCERGSLAGCCLRPGPGGSTPGPPG